MSSGSITDKSCRSQYQEFMYKFGVRYWKLLGSWRIRRSYQKDRQIKSGGYHSYTVDKTQVLNLFLSPYEFADSYADAVYCIIPKGTTYLHDVLGKEYLSASIIVVGVLDVESAKNNVLKVKQKS